MARLNINLGTNVNDGTGDKLRDAMNKINNNLIELFDRTGGDATQTGLNIAITGNVIGVSSDMTITTNSNGNLTIVPPTNMSSDVVIFGNLKVKTTAIDANYPVLINSNVRIKGTTTIGDNQFDDSIYLLGGIANTILPANDTTYDIGSVSSKFRNLYTGGTISTANIITPNANINGGTINNTVIGGSIPSIGHFATVYTTGDSFLGNLLIRDNMISNGTPNEDIEIRPEGTANVYVSTKLIVGTGSTPMVNPVLQATGNADNFSQIGVQNTNGGKFACSDIVVFTNEGSDFFNFADIGQNNSGWDGSLQYVYFDSGSAANGWILGDTLVQYDLTDGSSILARGVIDEIGPNPGTPSEIRARVCQIFEGTTGIFDQGSIHGNVYNERDWSNATPKDHVLETFLATGESKYDLGIHTLNGSTAKAAFSPTVVLAPDSVEVKIDGVRQTPGIDFTIQFSKILFYNVPAAGTTITIRQYPDANYPFTVGQSGHSYVYNNGGKFTIGTMTGHDLLFHVNGIRYTAEAGRIKAATKNWIIGSGVTSQSGFEDTGEKLQVHGVVKTDYVKGRTASQSISVDFELTPDKTIYSYTPTVDDININLTFDANNEGKVIIFNNRAVANNYNLFDANTSTFLVSVEPGTAFTVACDGDGWFLVS
jgi:hypothetical protein